MNAHLGPDRTPQYALSVASRPGETGIVGVCRILIDHLDQQGASWGAPVDLSQLSGHHEDGVDCEARDLENPDRKLAIQITRAEPSSDFWRRLNAMGKITHHDNEAGANRGAAVEALHRAIDRKARRIAPRQRSSITLALDATETPWQAFEPVVRMFRETHGPWAQLLGFQGIWLVGPISELTVRLDGVG